MTNEAWSRLGQLLIERRVALGGQKRLPWAKRLGLNNDRIMLDLENAKRTNYDAATLASMERLYQWAPGSIRRVLEGGDPVLADEVTKLEETAKTFHLLTPFDGDPAAGRHPAEVLFGEWYRTYRDLLDVEDRYASYRDIPIRDAIDELHDLFAVATGRDRPAEDWRPPWEQPLGDAHAELSAAAHDDESHDIEEGQGHPTDS